MEHTITIRLPEGTEEALAAATEGYNALHNSRMEPDGLLALMLEIDAHDSLARRLTTLARNLEEVTRACC